MRRCIIKSTGNLNLEKIETYYLGTQKVNNFLYDVILLKSQIGWRDKKTEDKFFSNKVFPGGCTLLYKMTGWKMVFIDDDVKLDFL